MNPDDVNFETMIDADVKEAEDKLAQLRTVQSYIREKRKSKGLAHLNGTKPSDNGSLVKVKSDLLKGRPRYEVCEIILKAAGHQMRTPEIVEAIQASGCDSDLKDNILSAAVFTAMMRKKNTFKKVGRGVWGLVAWNN